MNLKSIRKQRKLRQEDLANYLNIKQATYSGYESGKYEPNIETLIKLADYFHTSIDNLVREDKENINTIQKIKNNNLINMINQLNEYNLMKVEGYVENMLEEQNRSSKNG